MNKTYKKSDIDKYVGAIKNEHVVHEEDLNELVDTAGTMIDRNDNYVASPSLIKSKKTSDDFARSAAQGPEAYFIYGGPYYGVNYSYVVNEDEILDEEIPSNFEGLTFTKYELANHIECVHHGQLVSRILVNHDEGEILVELIGKVSKKDISAIQLTLKNSKKQQEVREE